MGLLPSLFSSFYQVGDRMSQVINETGKIYGELTVLQRANGKNGKAAWLCQCSCGNQIVVRGDSLRRGYNISCGCKAAERMKKVG